MYSTKNVLLTLFHLKAIILKIIDDTKSNFIENDGIEFIMDCYEYHNEFVMEVISCLSNVIDYDGNIY